MKSGMTIVCTYVLYNQIARVVSILYGEGRLQLDQLQHAIVLKIEFFHLSSIGCFSFDESQLSVLY